MSDIQIMGSVPRDVLEMRLLAVTRQAALLREAMNTLIAQHHSGRWTSQFEQGEDVTAVVADAVRFPATMAEAIWAIQLHAEAAAGAEDGASAFTVSELAEDGLATGQGSPGEHAALTRLLSMAVAAIDADDPLPVEQVHMLTRAGILAALPAEPAAVPSDRGAAVASQVCDPALPPSSPAPWRAARAWEGHIEPDADELADYMARPLTRIVSANPDLNVVNAHDLFEFRNTSDAKLLESAPLLQRRLQALVQGVQAQLQQGSHHGPQGLREAQALLVRLPPLSGPIVAEQIIARDKVVLQPGAPRPVSDVEGP